MQIKLRDRIGKEQGTYCKICNIITIESYCTLVKFSHCGCLPTYHRAKTIRHVYYLISDCIEPYRFTYLMSWPWTLKSFLSRFPDGVLAWMPCKRKQLLNHKKDRKKSNMSGHRFFHQVHVLVWKCTCFSFHCCNN